MAVPHHAADALASAAGCGRGIHRAWRQKGRTDAVVASSLVAVPPTSSTLRAPAPSLPPPSPFLHPSPSPPHIRMYPLPPPPLPAEARYGTVTAAVATAAARHPPLVGQPPCPGDGSTHASASDTENILGDDT